MAGKDNKKQMVITGASGLLGSNLALFFREQYDVIGVVSTHEVNIPGVTIARAELANRRECRRIAQELRPDIIIHCAALANIDQCEQDTSRAELLNHHMSQNIVESAISAACKLVYISTDAVYEGTQGGYRESHACFPVNYYGRTKLFGEQEFLRHPSAFIARTNFFGWNAQKKEGLGEWAINRLVKGDEVQGFQDAFFTSLYTFDLAKILTHVIERDIKGVYNIASRTTLSKYEFAVRIARELGVSEALVKPISIKEHTFRAPRGTNLSMDVSKIEAELGIQFPTFQETISHFIEDYKKDLPLEIRSFLRPSCPRIIHYGSQAIDQDDIDEVTSVLRSPFLTQGPKISEFERALTAITHSAHAVAVNSATSALHIACRAAGIGHGDEVITSPITFVASANCALYCGATPVFADIDERTHTIDPKEVAKKITPRTRAVIPVHLAGQSCDMKAIREVVASAEKKYGIKIYIIEDASHSIGSFYKAKPVGFCEFSDMAVFSFHPVKHITTGEGGAVCTNDDGLAKTLARLRSHGIISNPDEFVYAQQAFYSGPNGEKKKNPWYYEQIDIGYNYRLTDMQAALGLSQLDKLGMFRSRRKEIVQRYNNVFRDIPTLTTPFESPDCDTNFHLYILLWDFAKIGKTRAQVIHALRENGIQTQVHYIPVHTQPYYQQHLGTAWGQHPRAEHYYQRCLSLPLHPKLNDEDVERVIEEVKRVAT